jgi:Fe2+ transport system protein FeoA
LGVKKNKGVKVIRKSKFNGPLHIEIGTTQLMLRNLVAKQIKISHL